MFARVTQLEVDVLRTSVDDAVELFRSRIEPALREQEGYEGAYVLANDEGRAVLVTFWQTSEQARETPFYAGAIAEHVTLFRAPPGRESYEVRFADAPLAAG